MHWSCYEVYNDDETVKPGGIKWGNKKMNNKGKTSTMVGAGFVVLVLILGFVVYGQYKNEAFGAQPNSGQSGSIVTTATSLSFSGVDALQPGNAVSGTAYVSVNGAPFATGITSVTPGSKIDVLMVNGSTYHSAVVKDLTVSGTNAIVPVSYNGNASSVTLTAFNTNGVAITNAAVNQTVTAGNSYTIKVRADGQSLKSTQDMVMVIEANATALQPGQQGIIVSGGAAAFSGTSKPTFYSLSSVDNGVWTYNVAPVANGQSTEYTIQLNQASAKTLASGANPMTITFFAKESFLDSNTGKIAYDIQDSLGVKKAIATYKTTVAFT